MALLINNPELEAKLLTKSASLGLSPSDYLAQLIGVEESRQSRLAEFESELASRIADLDAGLGADGEPVMKALIQDLERRKPQHHAK